jgi:hypothetical protein
LAKAFLKRIEPNRPREKVIDWPFPVEGETPKLTMRVLGFDEIEASHLAAQDHFKSLKDGKGTKRNVAEDDQAFLAREALEKVWRAFKSEGEPIADDVDELAKQPISVILELHSQWQSFQADVAATPLNRAEMDALIEAMKKKIQPEALRGFASSWLISLCLTMASQLADLTKENSPGL